MATDLSPVTASLAPTSVAFDPGYDDRTRSIASVACSDGANGLMTRYKWNTQGDIPTFPYIGGFEGISGWNSTECGSCYSITYEGKTIHILGIDHTSPGFTITEQAMDDLTNGSARELGRVDAEFIQVDLSECKI